MLVTGFGLECGWRLSMAVVLAFWVKMMRYRVLQITWVLAFPLALYLAENLWLDAPIRAKFAGVPTLVPEPLTSLWFAVFAVGGVVCVVLVVGLVLVSRHRGISSQGKLATGMAVIVTCAIWGWWFSSTSGGTSAASGAGQHRHSVTLTWNASSSPVVGYNVYRSTVSGRGYVKINAALVKDRLGYKDENVESGKIYYYVTRAVDAKGKESGDSVEVVVTVP